MNYLFLLTILFMLFFISITEQRLRNLINLSSEIHLIIKGRGNQSFINNTFYPLPSEVYVNGIYKDSRKIFSEFEYEENNVTLIFDETIESCERMFSELDNIIEIDLSHFDFSRVTTMSFMFRKCSNLERIIFGDINTSSLINIKGTFYSCSKIHI